MMKNWCAWCLHPIDNSPEKYRNRGNMCSECMTRVGYVLIKGWSNKNKLSPEAADRQLVIKREQNIKKFGNPNDKNTN